MSDSTKPPSSDDESTTDPASGADTADVERWASDEWRFLVWIIENDRRLDAVLRLGRWVLLSVAILMALLALILFLVPEATNLTAFLGAAGATAGTGAGAALWRRRGSSRSERTHQSSTQEKT